VNKRRMRMKTITATKFTMTRMKTPKFTNIPMRMSNLSNPKGAMRSITMQMERIHKVLHWTTFKALQRISRAKPKILPVVYQNRASRVF